MYALISVSDKTGIVELCQALQKLGILLISTGGTADLLAEHGLEVIAVSEHTQFPEIMGGRVKTLHPKIHGGILGRRGIDNEIMQSCDIQPIDLVVVNLYPFVQTISKPQCTLAEAVENIDIGGPTLIRAAAKNHKDVGVVVDHQDYPKLIAELKHNQSQLSAATRFYYAQKAFAYTADYDANIANYLGSLPPDDQPLNYPLTYSMQFHKKQDLRYGENPHQTAAFYIEKPMDSGGLVTAEKIQGKTLSYNNIVDADTALECVLSFERPSCVILKHANPCGVASAADLLTAYQQAYKTDPISAFGGVIAVNRCLDKDTLQAILDQQFVEVIIAPCILEECHEIARHKPQVRLLNVGKRKAHTARLELKRVHGGLLVQDIDAMELNPDNWEVQSKKQPTEQQWQDMLFAFKVVRHVKSNAIVYAHSETTLGIGAGQMSRIDSVDIAGRKAKKHQHCLAQAVMASEAFLPFRDNIDHVATLGISAVVQSGGSKQDNEVIAAANEHKIVMVFTNSRHFKH